MLKSHTPAYRHHMNEKYKINGSTEPTIKCKTEKLAIVPYK